MSIPPNQASREFKDVSTSALELERSAEAVESSADRSTQLAAIRTILAADRTYAAWIRTALTALASGVGAKALLSGVVPSWLANFAGSVMVIFSAIAALIGIWFFEP